MLNEMSDRNIMNFLFTSLIHKKIYRHQYKVVVYHKIWKRLLDVLRCYPIFGYYGSTRTDFVAVDVYLD